MRWIPLAVAAALAGGCTHTFLERSTLRTASSISDFQTQQVLDNLALMACEPDANPWHLNLSSGLIQVTDGATGTLTGNVFSTGMSSNNVFIPSLSGQRLLVEQWSVNPVTDGEQIETLQVAYRKALDPQGNDVDDKVLEQIVDLCVRFSLLPKEETIRRILESGCARKQARKVIEALDREIGDLQREAYSLDRYRDKVPDTHPETAWRLEVRRRELAAKIDLKEGEREELQDLLEKKSKDPCCHNEDDRPTGSPSKGKRKKDRRLYKSRSPRQLTSANDSDTTLLILTALQAKSPAGYLPSTDIIWETTRNPALVDQAEDQISELEELLEFDKPWVWRGCKQDVPKCACYVGHFKGCQEDCYVWVMPDDFAKLQKFTRIIQTLGAPNASQETPARSPAFSPGLR